MAVTNMVREAGVGEWRRNRGKLTQQNTRKDKKDPKGEENQVRRNVGVDSTDSFSCSFQDFLGQLFAFRLNGNDSSALRA